MTTAPTADDYGTKRTINAVDDLGWDPSGKERVSKPPAEDGLTIEVPPGTYRRTGERWDYSRLNDWCFTGTGDPSDVTFLVEKGRICTVFNIRAGDWFVGNFTIDQRDDWDTSAGIKAHGANWTISGVHFAGWRPDQNQGATSALTAYAKDPNGTCYVDDFYADERVSLDGYPDNTLMFFSGKESVGDIYILNSEMENGGEHAIYASRTTGDVRIEDSTFRNNQNTQVRIAGEGSYAKNCRFEWTDHTNKGEFQAQTGLTFEAGFQGYSGGIVENCEFLCETTSPNSGVVKVDGSHGGMTIRDCSISVAKNARTPAINIEKPGDSHMIDGLPSKPWDVTIENVSVTFEGGKLWNHDAAVASRGRDVVYRDLCVDVTADAGGEMKAIRHEGGRAEFAGECSVEAPTDARRLVTNNANRVGWGDVATSADCSTLPVAGAEGGADEPAQPEEPVPVESPSYEHEARVRAASGITGTTYEFTTTGPVALQTTGDFAAAAPDDPDDPLSKGERVTENDDGTFTVTGIVADGGGDSFTFDGEITDWAHVGPNDDDVVLSVDGTVFSPPDSGGSTGEEAPASGGLTEDDVLTLIAANSIDERDVRTIIAEERGSLSAGEEAEVESLIEQRLAALVGVVASDLNTQT